MLLRMCCYFYFFYSLIVKSVLFLRSELMLDGTDNLDINHVAVCGLGEHSLVASSASLK